MRAWAREGEQFSTILLRRGGLLRFCGIICLFHITGGGGREYCHVENIILCLVILSKVIYQGLASFGDLFCQDRLSCFLWSPQVIIISTINVSNCFCDSSDCFHSKRFLADTDIPTIIIDTKLEEINSNISGSIYAGAVLEKPPSYVERWGWFRPVYVASI